MSIEVQGLTKRFGAVAAADNVSLTVPEGSLTALLGPSGSGKTTVLRMIAGLEIPDSGSISIGGEDVTSIAARHRNIGFVFQHYALFKHMKVQDNIAFPLKVRRWKRQAIRERVDELVKLLRLDGLESRYPGQISGGQRQRVALARALASRPRVLLLDEPFSALDARVREELREWLRGLHDQLHVTSLFVTHDQTEASELADNLVILSGGQVAQAGPTAEIYAKPASPFVMEFLGKANALAGTALHGEADIQGFRVPFPAANGRMLSVVGYVRPQHLALSPAPSGHALRARVLRAVPSGTSVKVHLETEDGATPLVAEIEGDGSGLVPGSIVYLQPREFQVFEVPGS